MRIIYFLIVILFTRVIHLETSAMSGINQNICTSKNGQFCSTMDLFHVLLLCTFIDFERGEEDDRRSRK